MGVASYNIDVNEYTMDNAM